MNIFSKTILAAALFLAGCGVIAGGGESPPSGAAAAGAPTAEVKVIKNTEVVASYRNDGARAAVFEGELMVGLDSPDLQHTLIVYVGASQTGAYPIGEGEGPGKAWIQFMSEALPTPAFAAEKGEVKVTELSGGTCSGSLTATRTEANGDRYTVEAAFSKVPVRTRKQ